MAGANDRQAIEEDAAYTKLRLSLLRERLKRTQDEINWEITAFSLRNPDSVVE